MKLIYIEWYDAHGRSGGWFQSNELKEWARRQENFVAEVGWLIEETKEYLLLANKQWTGSNADEHDLGGITKIPKTWIRKRKTIKV